MYGRIPWTGRGQVACVGIRRAASPVVVAGSAAELLYLGPDQRVMVAGYSVDSDSFRAERRALGVGACRNTVPWARGL